MIELSIVMPCLNEERTLAACIREAKQFLVSEGVEGEVVVADNGSEDRSREIAVAAGARVVEVPRRGYGSAILAGIEAAHGRYVAIGDADQSYDFTALRPFLDALRAGADLVVGNRFAGGIEPGAMPWLHRFLGNPVLSLLGRLFYRIDIGDFHCGLRALRRESVSTLGLATPGMEFASEMIVKSALARLRIVEVPTRLRVDGRDRRPHLRTWADGWRHLRFLLLLAPRWLFIYPGAFAFAIGLGGMIALLPGPLSLGSMELDVHTMLYMAALMLAGAQSLALGVFSKMFALRLGLRPADPAFDRVFSGTLLETGLVLGSLFCLLGVGLSTTALLDWQGRSFGGLDPANTMRVVIPAATSFLLGMQLMLASFFLGVLRLDSRHGATRQ